MQLSNFVVFLHFSVSHDFLWEIYISVVITSFKLLSKRGLPRINRKNKALQQQFKKKSNQMILELANNPKKPEILRQNPLS